MSRRLTLIEDVCCDLNTINLLRKGIVKFNGYFGEKLQKYEDRVSASLFWNEMVFTLDFYYNPGDAGVVFAKRIKEKISGGGKYCPIRMWSGPRSFIRSPAYVWFKTNEYELVEEFPGTDYFSLRRED